MVNKNEKVNNLGNENELVGVLNNINSLYGGLIDKPLINGVTLEGNKTLSELGIENDKNFMFTQQVANKVWEIHHNLNKFPSIVVVDSAGSVVVGDIKYIDVNNVTIIFSGAFSGKCYLN